MKVLHIISRLNVGGTPKYIGNLANGLISNGIDVILATGEVVTPEIEDPLAQMNYVVRIPNLKRPISLHDDFLAYIQINALIKKCRPDIIHTHAFKAGLLTRLSFTNIPIIHTFHGHLFANPEFSKIQVACIKLLEKILDKKTAKIITVGESVGSDLVSMGIIQKEKTQSIPPGINPFATTSEKDLKFLNQNKIDSKGRPVIGWLGRITSVKNPSRVLELAAARQDLMFVVAGSGEMQDLFTNHKLENLRFFQWANTEEIFGSIDVLLSTSHNEGMPLLLMEAAMCGVPVVANNVGAISEILVDGVNAILCDDTISSYSKGIDTILQKLTSKQFDITETQKELTKKFSIKAMVDAHKIVYDSVLRRN